MKKVLVAAVGALAFSAVPATFASIQVAGIVHVGSQSQSLAFSSLGSGTYEAAAGSLGGVTWGPILAQTTGSALSTSFFQIDNTNSGSAKSVFTVSESGLTSSTAFQSMQPTGSISVTGATSSDTVDFNSLVQNGSSTIIGLQDSGALSLNTTNPYSPSSSVAYDSTGMNLTPSSTTVEISDTWTLNMGGGVLANFGGMVTNLQTTTVITPEPAALAIFGLGALALGLGARRRVIR